MKIRRIEIRNFKILQEIDIAFDGGLTFLNANNGCGKTTFQEAIRWCLYGDHSAGDSEPLASSLATGGPEVQVSVKIDVENPKNDEAIEISRSVLWDVARNRPSESEMGSKLRVRISGLKKAKVKGAEVLSNPRSWVEENFPASLLSYFLFDGETMYKFFEDDVKLKMGAAIKSIARVKSVDELEALFRTAAARFRSAAAKEAGPDVIEINRKREEILEGLNREREVELPEAEKRRQSWSDLKEKSKQTLSRIEDAKGLLRTIDDYERDGGLLERAADEVDRLNNQFVEDLLKRPFLAFASAFEEIPGLVDKAKRENWYPLPFSVAALEELIAEGECICGNHLKKGSEAEKAVLQIIAKRKSLGEKGVELGDLASGVQAFSSRIDEAARLIHRTNQDIIDAQTKVTDLQETYQEKISELGNLSVPAVKDAQDDYDRSTNGLNSATTDLERLREKIKIEEGNLEKADRALADARGQSAEEVRLNHLAEKADRLAAASRKLANEAIEDVKRRIKKSMDDAFHFVGEGEFQTTISEDFALDTVDSRGKPAGLSEGQKMMRAYIFSIALREVVGYQFPLLVDTPLGRLDTTNSREAANLLSEFASSAKNDDGVQIIMSMHDGEYTPYVKQHFANADPQELYFAYKVPAKQSILGEGIDPAWSKLPGAWHDWKAGKVAQG